MCGFAEEPVFLPDFDVFVVCEDGGDAGAHLCVRHECGGFQVVLVDFFGAEGHDAREWHLCAPAECADDSVVKVEYGVTVGGEGRFCVFCVCVCNVFFGNICDVAEGYECVELRFVEGGFELEGHGVPF